MIDPYYWKSGWMRRLYLLVIIFCESLKMEKSNQKALDEEIERIHDLARGDL